MKKWLLLLFSILVIALSGFVVWAETPPAPMPEAIQALQPDAQVQVDTQPWFTFRPDADLPQTGLIFYPGGRIDARAYAPAARALAARGYLVVIVPMPLNLAVTAPGKASQVLAAFPGVKNWAIGGHSLGGAMAANFALRNLDRIDGLVLWASYPASSDNLSTTKLSVVSIYGTRDGLATPEKIAASRPLLPPSTLWVALQGGNHAQFGWYGPQVGDNPASISREEQQQVVIQATAGLLASLGASPQ